MMLLKDCKWWIGWKSNGIQTIDTSNPVEEADYSKKKLTKLKENTWPW